MADWRVLLAQAMAENPSLRDDLDETTPRRPIRYGTPMPSDGAQAMLGQAPLPNVPRETMPQPSFLEGLRDRLFSGGPLPYNTDLRRGDNNYTSRNALRMFVQGLNANPRMVGEHGEYGIRGAVAGRNSGYRAATPRAPEDPRIAQAKLDEILSRIAANNALATRRGEHPEDPFEADKHGLYASRIGANDALAERRRRPDQPRATGGGGSRGGGGNKPLTMAQRRAQINALAQAEKQRVIANLKNKYRDVYDYNNPTSGKPEGKRIVDAAIARGIAQVEQEHARVLRELGADYGMEQGEDAPPPVTQSTMSRAEQMKQEMLAAKNRKAK